MAMNPVLLKLVEESAVKYRTESDLKRSVRGEVELYERKKREERIGWFCRNYLPQASVLARLPRHDRDAVIAHFRAKELLNVANAVNYEDHYDAYLARKRLERVEAMSEAFAEVDHERRFCA